MKLKKILASILGIAMVLGTMGITVLAAEETTCVAKVGSVECVDATAMVNALNNAFGDVTVEIYGKVETNGFGLKNSNITKLSFVGMAENAEICVDGISYIDVRYTGYPVEYTGLTLSHINAGQNIDGYLPQYFSTYNGGNVTYTNCTFPNGVTACGSVAGTTYKFVKCTFNNRTSGFYSLWVYGNSTNVLIDGGIFSGVRGIKMYSEGSNDFSNLSVSEATFSDTITEKYAIVLTKGESVTLIDNTFNNTTGTIQIDDDCASLIEGKTVTIDGRKYIVDSENLNLEETTPAETTVAKIGETYYESLQAAAAAAEASASTSEIVIEILDDITLDTGIIFEKSSNITINGNGHTITLVDDPEHAAADDWYANAFRPVNQPTGFSITDEAYYSEKAGSVFTLNDMTLVNKKSGPTDVYSSGHTGRARYLTYAYAEKVYYNNIDFIGGVTSSANTYFEGCTFTTDDPEEYCLFVDHEYSSEDNKYEIEVNNCTFNPASTAYGGLKIANQDAELVLTVEDTTFNSVPNKAAINADTNVSATLSNNVYNNCLIGTYKSDDNSPVTKTNETITTQTELAQNTNTTVTYNTSQILTVEKASGSVTTNAENAESIAKKWCAYKFEIVPDGSKINVKVEADGKESQNKTQELANIEAKNVSVGVTVTGVDNLTSIAVTTVE